MADADIGFLEWGFKGVVGILFTVGGWLWVMLIGKVKEQQTAIDANKDALADHKLHVSETYAKSDSLTRIHDRLDDMSKDIKTLIGQVGNPK